MLLTTPNLYLLLLAALGWMLSLYFGFFRYRQFVWSRNKVRSDILLKLDRQRASLAAKVLVVSGIGNGGPRNQMRLNGLLRRYVDLLRQMAFVREEDLVDAATTAFWQAGVERDLRDWSLTDTTLITWLRGMENLPASASQCLNKLETSTV